MNNTNLYLSLLLGFSMAAMPYIVSKTIAFGVRVPSKEFKDPYLRKLRVIWVLVNLVVFSIVGLTDVIDFTNQTTSVWLILLLVYNLSIFIVFNTIVKKYKGTKNWNVNNKVVVPLMNETKQFKLTYIFVYLLIIVITFVVCSYYDVISFKLFSDQLLASTIFSVAALTGARSRKQISSVAPKQSFLVVTNFRYRVIVSLSILGYILVSMMALQYFKDMEILDQQLFKQILSGVFIVYLMIFVHMLYAGNKRNRDEVESDLLEHNDDKYWKLGLIYVNKNDSSIFVEKRNSIGWTVNFGNKFVLVALIALITFYLVIGVLGG